MIDPPSWSLPASGNRSQFLHREPVLIEDQRPIHLAETVRQVAQRNRDVGKMYLTGQVGLVDGACRTDREIHVARRIDVRVETLRKLEVDRTPGGELQRPRLLQQPQPIPGSGGWFRRPTIRSGSRWSTPPRSWAVRSASLWSAIPSTEIANLLISQRSFHLLRLPRRAVHGGLQREHRLARHILHVVKLQQAPNVEVLRRKPRLGRVVARHRCLPGKLQLRQIQTRIHLVGQQTVVEIDLRAQGFL